MTTVSIKEARKNFSSLINKAQHGGKILITRRGKIIAKLEGIESTRPRFPSLLKFRKTIKIRGTPLSKAVIQGRKEERF